MIKYTKYERARLVGARALQIAMGAPLLLDMKEEDLERINYDCVTLARLELEKGILPLRINKSMPKKTE